MLETGAYGLPFLLAARLPRSRSGWCIGYTLPNSRQPHPKTTRLRVVILCGPYQLSDNMFPTVLVAIRIKQQG